MAALLPALALAAGPGALPASAAPEPAPDISLVVPDRLVAFSEGNRVYSDLGVTLENQGGPLEIWSTRGTPGDSLEQRYDDPVQVTTRDSEGTQTGTLPSETGARLNGLRDLVSVKVKPVTGSGGALRFTSGRTCLGGEGAQRIAPEGPATSPYPDYCWGSNPFTLASVQGIPGGWGSPVLEPYGSLRIPRGAYDVTITMDDEVADGLGVPAEDRVQTMRLRVKPYPRSGGGFKGDGRGDDDAGTALRPSALSARDEAAAPPEGYPLPDLEALPAFGMRIARDGNYLQFSATVWNSGTSPLVVDGFRRDGEDVMDGYQYYFDQDGNQLPEYTPVGEFEWDPKPTHLHWHFRSFAQYSLVPYDAPVVPGDEDDHHVKSRKEAFCLANTDAVDLTGEGAAWKVDNTDLSTACGDYGSRSIREVLAAGWGDTYAQFRAGQSFNLKNVPNGCYDIVVEGNPVMGEGPDARRTLFESDETNNVTRRTVEITGKAGARKVTVTGVGVVEPGPTPEELGCEPHDH